MATKGYISRGKAAGA